MKAKPSIAFNEFSGTAKEVTARLHKGRQLLSTRARQPLEKTPAQARQRSSFSKITRAYKTLTDSQMQEWQQLAQTLKSKSTLGSKIPLTAHNLFVRLNSNRALVKEPLLFEAPKNQTIPSVSYTDFWLTPDKILFTGLNKVSNNLKLIMKMSSGASAGVSSGFGDVVVVSPGVISDWGDADVMQDYIDTKGFPPTEGQKYFIELYWLDTQTGFTGEHSKASAICCSTGVSGIHKAQLVERLRYTAKELVPEDPKDKISSFDYELSEKGNFGTIGAVCEIGSYMAGIPSKAEIKENMPQYTRQYVIGRGRKSAKDPEGKSDQYELCDVEITCMSNSGKYDIALNLRSGSTPKAFELYGTSPLVANQQ